ncbi:golgin subfamily A member 1 isoform X4 [Solenopsis invicta]|uniref:golgin subfamily A member 1 isoform X4 n=1 Tax=Solenopsis invicta TaxID=13686 RepID=UPI00193D931D|nr:golgin subfamily A member 1 isoform X4 [Solenopsis invicta]
MFASLKNKIREEIGSDVSTVIKNAGNIRGINSRHMSQADSINSISGSQVSLDASKEENITLPVPSVSPKRENSFELKLNDGMQLTVKDIKKFENREDEWRKRLAKKEAEVLKRMEKREEEWKVRLFEKEKEWKKVVEKQEKEKQRLEEEIKKIEVAKQSLEHALKNAEEYKKKLYSFQEDAEQLEGFQTQEMAKVKHLLLTKEQEVGEKTHHLKIATAEIENLKTEVSRLRRYEDELNNVQESSSNQITQLKLDLEIVTSKFTAATNELASLRMSLEKEQSSNSSLCSELTHLRQTLEFERAAMTELRVILEKERGEKDTVLLRNAQMSQDIEIVKQENRQRKNENMELQSKIENLEDILVNKVKEAEQVIVSLKEFEQKVVKLDEAERTKEKLEGNERILKSSLLDLEEQLSEKNKTIKILQQRLTDMKKTLQRELKIPSSSLDSDVDVSAAILNPSSSKTVTARHNTREDDVNFKYLKHVLIKFLTSREYEIDYLNLLILNQRTDEATPVRKLLSKIFSNSLTRIVNYFGSGSIKLKLQDTNILTVIECAINQKFPSCNLAELQPKILRWFWTSNQRRLT